MDLSGIENIYVGSTEIAAVYAAGQKIWPAGGPVFVTEKHALEEYGGWGTWSGLQVSGYRFWGGLVKPMGTIPGKSYFEWWLDGTAALVEITFNAGGTWYDDNSGLRIIDDGKIRAENSSSGTFSGMVNGVDGGPYVLRFAMDIPNQVGWVAVDNQAWNTSASANPATGVGGLPLTSTNWAGSDAISLYFDAADEYTISLLLHAHQFKYAAPAGFGEITISGEYA